MNHYKAEAAVRLLLLNVVLDTLVAAKARISYSEAANLIGMQARSGTFFDLLTQTMEEDFAKCLPPRCGLIVNKKDGKPSPAFFAKAKALGYPAGNPDLYYETILILFKVQK